MGRISFGSVEVISWQDRQPMLLFIVWGVSRAACDQVAVNTRRTGYNRYRLRTCLREASPRNNEVITILAFTRPFGLRLRNSPENMTVPPGRSFMIKTIPELLTKVNRNGQTPLILWLF